MASKHRTYDQAASAQQKAIRFASDVLQNDDLADDLASESVESYADRKGLVLTNPSLQRRAIVMANGNITKDDLQDACDQVESILTAAYTPEATRSDLVDAIADALNVLGGDTGDDGDDDQDDADDDQ